MRGPAGMLFALFLLAIAAAAQAAAADRFVPADPNFVVAECPGGAAGCRSCAT